MKKVYFLALLLLPTSLFSQALDAVAFINKVMEKLKNDAIVEMSYNYKVYDEEELLTADEGVMILDGERYVLLLEGMKVWCDGKRQWSYVEISEEVYLTDAASDDAQNLSPLYIIEACRDGYESSIKFKDDIAIITLIAQAEDGLAERVEFTAGVKDCLLRAMNIYMFERGRIDIKLDNYKANCKFNDADFEFPAKDFPAAVVVDMR